MIDKADTTISSDPIDRFVEDLARHPERASDLKIALRRKLREGIGARTPVAPIKSEPCELEEFWDNVPI